ncbi:O-methyltransferase [Luteococcus sp.]|uniref:O-methyltransferase n=1 Tax=Luteococcus sp. TaxID=1969402 RepID=UPI003736FDED
MSTATEIPPLVSKALSQCLRTGWLHTTRNETGRLLATLAASRTGTVAGVSTGSSTGVAWLRSGASEATRVVCVESDPRRAAQAREILFGSDIEVLDGDCEQLRCRAPFSLLYMNRATAQVLSRDLAHELVETGGLVLIDDLEEDPFRDNVPGVHVDPLLEGWLTDERFTSTESQLAPDLTVMIATRT